ncbi:MAG: hypothetical protein AAB489_00330 [Patescibacteria group bacterium]
MVLLDILIIGMLLLIVTIVITALGHLWVATPFVPTATKVAEAMIDCAEFKGNETAYDLGAGDGKILIHAKRRFPGITAKGYEIALGVWFFGLIRIFLSRTGAQLFWRDALKQNLRDADVIFLYLLPHMMRRCAEKFDRELRPGTKVISHAFQFHGKEPMAQHVIPVGRSQKKVFVYQW